MKNILFILFNFICLISYSQIKLTAKLKNNSSEPIVFASVLVQETLEGTITDHLGIFDIEIVDENFSLIFQCLGYKSDTFLVKDVLIAKEIILDVNDYELSEVVVLPKNAFKIMRKAIDKIQENYNSKTIAQNVFYRQEIIANNELLSLEEANFNALVKYKNKNVNISTINKARVLTNLDTLKSLGKILETQLEEYDSINIRENTSQFFGLNFLLQDDLGKGSKDLFGEKSNVFYKYSYNGLVKKDTFSAYHITFDQVDNLKKSLFKGHLYIDTESLAFIDFSIYLSPKGIKYQKIIPKSLSFIAKILGYSIYIKGFSYNAHYLKKGKKWYLDKVESKLSAKVSKKNGGSFDGYFKTMFHINKFYLKEGFYNKKSIYDKIESNKSDFENSAFWGKLKHIPLFKYEKELIEKLKKK